jgi:hypothetical protein
MNVLPQNFHINRHLIALFLLPSFPVFNASTELFHQSVLIEVSNNKIRRFLHGSCYIPDIQILPLTLHTDYDR